MDLLYVVIGIIVLISLGGTFILLTIDFLRDFHKKRINKLLDNIERERDYYKMWCDIVQLKEELEELKKRYYND